MSQSVLQVACSKVPLIKGPDGHILTAPFLDVCRLVVDVVEKLGTAFALVKADINGNIQRLADRVGEDPARYTQLFPIVRDEMVKGTHTGSSSCAKGLLWLKRAMEFMVAILRRTCDQPSATLAQVVADVYGETLYKYHGFLVSSAFTLAFKFVPSRDTFLQSLSAGDVDAELRAFADAFAPVLAEVQQFMVENDLDDPAKV